MALAYSFLPKEQFLKDVGVSGEWPCWGFPDIVHVENAAELNGRMMHGARRRYLFDIRIPRHLAAQACLTANDW
jgi:putative transposase